MKYTKEFIAETRKSIKSNNTKIISKGILLDMLDEIEKLQKLLISIKNFDIDKNSCAEDDLAEIFDMVESVEVE